MLNGQQLLAPLAGRPFCCPRHNFLMVLIIVVVFLFVLLKSSNAVTLLGCHHWCPMHSTTLSKKAKKRRKSQKIKNLFKFLGVLLSLLDGQSFVFFFFCFVMFELLLRAYSGSRYFLLYKMRCISALKYVFTFSLEVSRWCGG